MADRVARHADKKNGVPDETYDPSYGFHGDDRDDPRPPAAPDERPAPES